MNNNGVTVLPDGSACALVSFPLPKDHWIYQKTGEPPVVLGQLHGDDRKEMAAKIREAARYAIRASTRSGQDMDFDPDAMMQNLIVGLIGYWGTAERKR